MRILVVSQYYYPEQFRINDICEELVKRGHSVTVLTGQPNYPDGEIYSGYENLFTNEKHNGVSIIRCKIIPRHKGAIKLLINYLSFAFEASRVIKRIDGDYDVVYVYQLSPVLSAIPAIKIKKSKKKSVFLYCCDIWPESVRDTDGEPMSIHNPIYLVSKWISKYIYKRVDIIGVKCNQFADYLHSVCKIDKEKCVLIYEHAESTYLSISKTPIENNCYDFMFLGNIGLAQHCEYIVKAAEKINADCVFKIHFVGSGSGLESLKQYVEERGLENRVVFHGRHPVSEINSYYEIADCCMLTLSAKTATGLTPPSKLVGYMAASRPIIAAAEGATVDLINDADCGISVCPEDIDGLANAMFYAIEHKDEFRQKGIKGREYFVNHFTLSKYIDQLEYQLTKLVGGY